MSAGIKWSAFTAGSTPLTGADQFVGLESGVNVRWTINQLTSFLSTSTLAAGTITTSQPLTLTQTWNAGGVTFDGLLVNITPTASAAGSLFVDIQNTNSTVFGVAADGSIRNPSFLDVYIAGTRSIRVSSTSLDISPNSGSVIPLLCNGVPLSFAADGSTRDLYIYRDAANVLAQRNGTNAQKLRVYKSYTDGSNYSALTFDVGVSSGNAVFIGSEGAGSGSATLASLAFNVNGAQKLDYNYSASGTNWYMQGSLVFPDNTYDIGASGATRPRNYFGGGNLDIAGGSGFGAASSTSTWALHAAGTTTRSQLRFVQGVAPTSPVDGDMWREDNTNTGLKIRINGVTKTITVA